MSTRKAWPEIDQITAIRHQIAPWIRRTPIVEVGPCTGSSGFSRFLLKLESLQITGSFKPRGALAMAESANISAASGLITASGGNHGLGVAYAAACLGTSSVVYLPESTPSVKADLLRQQGADVRYFGSVWDDAYTEARRTAGIEGRILVHPFADPLVIAGQATVGLEIMQDTADIDTIVVAVGGGGLISGVSIAAKALNPELRIVGVEPAGAPTHFASRQAGELTTLDKIATRAGTLAPKRSAQINFEIISDLVDEIILVDDDEMRDAAQWLWRELHVGVELAGAASVAACLSGRIETSSPLAIVCGAGQDGL